ncbi:MAG: VOC family protein [Desertimonas sp.]
MNKQHVNREGQSAMRMRQLTVLTDDLTATERLVEERFGLSLCFRDPDLARHGLRQALYPVGDQFLELVEPDGTSSAAGRLLDRRGGPCFFMAIFQVPDIGPHRARLNASGVRIVMEPTKATWSALHMHPADVAGVLTSIDQDESMTAFSPSGPTWRDHIRTTVTDGFSSLTITTPSADDDRAAWARVLGLDPIDGVFGFDDGELRVSRDDRGADAPRSFTITLRATDSRRDGMAIELGDTRLELGRAATGADGE